MLEIIEPIAMAARMVICGDAKGVFLMVGFWSLVLILAELRLLTHPVIASLSEF